MTRSITLFYIYAQTDEMLRQQLEKHLALLRRQKVIVGWEPILAGAPWVEQTEQGFQEAELILLLVSADFLDSDVCYEQQMQRALERERQGAVKVVPILLRPVDCKGAPFAYLRMLPQNANPITMWSDRDLAFKDVAMQLRKVVEDLQGQQYRDMHENEGLEYTFPHQVQAISTFRHYQKKVSELKSVHNMLHEIEVQLEGLSATIQLLRRDEKHFARNRPPLFPKREINTSISDFNYIEIIWRQVVVKIDDLAYFASEVVEVLEDERFSLDSNAIRGAAWIKDLFILQRSFEIGMRDQNRESVTNVSNELLIKCRSHLYRIDKRLLEAIKELDVSSDFMIRDKT